MDVDRAVDDPRIVVAVAKPKDFLAELIDDSTLEDPLFPVLHRAAQLVTSGGQLTHQFTALERLSQTELAHRMGTKQPVVSRLLSGDVDPQHSTEDRLAAAMGMRIERRLVNG